MNIATPARPHVKSLSSITAPNSSFFTTLRSQEEPTFDTYLTRLFAITSSNIFSFQQLTNPQNRTTDAFRPVPNSFLCNYEP